MRCQVVGLQLSLIKIEKIILEMYGVPSWPLVWYISVRCLWHCRISFSLLIRECIENGGRLKLCCGQVRGSENRFTLLNKAKYPRCLYILQLVTQAQFPCSDLCLYYHLSNRVVQSQLYKALLLGSFRERTLSEAFLFRH